jgi:sodium transport system ATP-binding protein
MLVAQALRKRFAEIVAVDDVSLQADDGRITGLLGPNGAGKTTTLRLLYGLMRPDAGSVRIDDVDVVAQPLAAQAKVGVLPDAHGLYPRLTAREHIRYFGELQGLRGDELELRIAELLVKLDMRSIADRRAQGFSQGERMKVSLARALVHGPNNVILDEPTNGLDVMSTRAMRKLIRELRDEGKCVLFSSHVMQEVSALCDVIVIVAGGRVVASGTPDELRALSGHDDLEDVFVHLTGLESVGGGAGRGSTEAHA